MKFKSTRSDLELVNRDAILFVDDLCCGVLVVLWARFLGVVLVLFFKVGMFSLRMLLYDFATVQTGRFSFRVIFNTCCLSRYLGQAFLLNELRLPSRLAHLR